MGLRNGPGFVASALGAIILPPHRYEGYLSVCLSVFPHDISRTDAARITNLDVEMFHRESWKTIYFGVKRSWSRGIIKVTNHENIASVVHDTLVSAGFFWFNLIEMIRQLVGEAGCISVNLVAGAQFLRRISFVVLFVSFLLQFHAVGTYPTAFHRTLCMLRTPVA